MKLQAAEILVIDGGSTDATVARASELKVPVINAGRVGLGAQRQVGVRATREPFIALIDADDRPGELFLKTLFEEMQRLAVDAISGITKSAQLNSYWQRGWSNALFSYREQPTITNMVGRPALYRTGALIDIGFDDSFTASEDTDIGYAFQLAGKRQALGTGISWRFHEASFVGSIKKWSNYGSGYAQFADKYPEKKLRILYHVTLNIGLVRPIKKLPDSLPYFPFYWMYSFFVFMAFLNSSMKKIFTHCQY